MYSVVYSVVYSVLQYSTWALDFTDENSLSSNLATSSIKSLWNKREKKQVLYHEMNIHVCEYTCTCEYTCASTVHNQTAPSFSWYTAVGGLQYV